jgi:hypothetical protein
MLSDDAVGEVWEGTQPSSLGLHRERQLAAILTGQDYVPPAPLNLLQAPPAEAVSPNLAAYLVLEDGRSILTGKSGRRSWFGPQHAREDQHTADHGSALVQT